MESGLSMRRTIKPTASQGDSKIGERVKLQGKKVKNDLGEPRFEVHRMTKDLGQCTATTGEQR
jgi:hypothetical protein